MNKSPEQMVNSIRIQIRNYKGDVRTAYKAVRIQYGIRYADAAMRAYEEAKWLRTPAGSKIGIDPEFAKDWA